MENLWTYEEHPAGIKYYYQVKQHLFSGESPFQKVDVVDTKAFGKMLFNDNLAMVSEKDEFIYHDMIAHVPLFAHPKPESVLIIGGGDGGTLREVLRHSNVKKCVMVEIDEMVVNACKEHIPLTASAMNDPRAEVIIEDGLKYVAETSEKFDVVMVDSTDPIGPATPLFGEKFYTDVFKVLNDQGIVVCQAESPFFNRDMQVKVLSVLSGIFPRVHAYNYNNLTYPGGLWTFGYASKGVHPFKELNVERVKLSGLEFQYYNPSIHMASFLLPSFQIKNYGNIVSDL